MRIDGRTKLVGVIGHPVAHTLSPAMHNAAFAALGMNWVYAAFDIHPSNLHAAVRGLAAAGVAGLNCTVPHKENIVSLLDEVDEDARVTGSVNTVEVREGKLIGHSTDGEGFLRSLRDDLGFEAAVKNVVIVGAGGAARAIVAALCSAGATAVTVANRTFSRAEKLCADIATFCENTSLKPVQLGDDAVRPALKEAQLVVNATLLGWSEGDACPVEPDALHEGLAVLDTCYKPGGTPLLEAAKQRGLRCANGLGMLVYQGAASFRIWTGREAPVKEMHRAAEEAITIE